MGSRILLADDSITIQKVVNLTFADEGIEVVAVSNGDLAERRLNEVKPDLVLADIFMPGKNGYELCESIKENPQFRNVPVVLLVGAFEPFDQAEASRVRADAHLTKPFESRTLVETVRRLISASGQTNTGPIAQMPSPGDGREEIREDDSTPPRLTETTPKLDLSEMMVDRVFAPVASPTRNTGELASPLDTSPQLFDPGVEEIPAHEAVNETLTYSSEILDPIGQPSMSEFPPVDMPAAFNHDEQEMILDFDRSDSLESRAGVSALTFDTEGSAIFDVDVSGLGGEGEGSSPDKIDAFEMPSSNEAWETSTPASPPGRQAPDFSLHAEGAFAPSEGATETAAATLLAVDEPLGDVLLDETVSAGLLQFSPDSLDIELTEPAMAEPSAIGSTQFDLVETGDDSSSQASVAVEESIEGREAHGAEPLPRLIDQPNGHSADLPADLHSASAEGADILDWTSPSASDYTTSHLDADIMPIDAAEYLAESSTGNGAQQSDNDQEASFESAKMWPEEEARFSAIDIEALPVEESEPAPDRLDAGETGFALSSITPQQPASSVATEGTIAKAQPVNDAATPATELSSAAIDEIVRRVVVEMSSSVVREVAWEVVPDCVERVIDQLTRESLAKRA